MHCEGRSRGGASGLGSVCRLRMRERCLHLIRRRHLRGDGSEVPVPVAFAVAVVVAVSIADVAINQQISERGKQGGK